MPRRHHKTQHNHVNTFASLCFKAPGELQRSTRLRKFSEHVQNHAIAPQHPEHYQQLIHQLDLPVDLPVKHSTALAISTWALCQLNKNPQCDLNRVKDTLSIAAIMSPKAVLSLVAYSHQKGLFLNEEVKVNLVWEAIADNTHNMVKNEEPELFEATKNTLSNKQTKFDNKYILRHPLKGTASLLGSLAWSVVAAAIVGAFVTVFLLGPFFGAIATLATFGYALKRSLSHFWRKEVREAPLLPIIKDAAATVHRALPPPQYTFDNTSKKRHSSRRQQQLAAISTYGSTREEVPELVAAANAPTLEIHNNSDFNAGLSEEEATARALAESNRHAESTDINGGLSEEEAMRRALAESNRHAESTDQESEQNAPPPSYADARMLPSTTSEVHVHIHNSAPLPPTYKNAPAAFWEQHKRQYPDLALPEHVQESMSASAAGNTPS